MLIRKTLGVARTAILGTVALIGSNAAYAVIDVNADTPIKPVYSKEGLITTEVYEPAGGPEYCLVQDGDDRALDIQLTLKQFPANGDSVYLRFDLHNMVFSQLVEGEDLVESDGTPVEGHNVSVSEGGAVGDSHVIMSITAAGTGDLAVNEKVALKIEEIGILPDTPGGVEVWAFDTLPDAQAMQSTLGSGGLIEDAVTVASGVTEAASPSQPAPTADVAEEYAMFVPINRSAVTDHDDIATAAQIGGFSITVNTGVRQQTGTPLTAADFVEVFTAVTSKYTLTGDFSVGTFFWDVPADNEMAVDCVLNTDDVTALSANKEKDMVVVTDITTLQNGKTLCVTIPGSNAKAINASEYNMMVGYTKAGAAGTRKFAATGESNLVGEIVRNGTTVHIPYLTTHSSYNQRIVIVNRGEEPAHYMTSFTPEDGVTVAGGGGDRGMVAAGETLSLVMNPARAVQNGQMPVVNITGGNRTAATLMMEADPNDIDVAVVTINLADGTTDTMAYYDAQSHRPHLTRH